jgi:hypothetical protein
VRLAVSRGLPQSQVRTDDPQALERFVNTELRPVLEQLRRATNALNPEPTSPSVVSDGAGTYSTLWTSAELPQEAVWQLEARVCGCGATERASYLIVTTIQSIAGVVSPLGATSIVHEAESAVACNARFSYDATLRTVIVEACDAATEAMTWTSVVQTFESVQE